MNPMSSVDTAYGATASGPNIFWGIVLVLGIWGVFKLVEFIREHNHQQRWEREQNRRDPS